MPRRDLDGVSDDFLAGRAAEQFRYTIEETGNLPGPT